MSNYHIVYPCGDRNKLCVVEICDGMEYELFDYAVASRQSFSNYQNASTYAKELAKINGLSYQRGDQDEPDYLD